MAINTNNQSKPAPRVRHHYIRHPIQSYQQIKNQQTKLINKRKEQLINDEDVPDYSKGRNQLLVLIIGVIVVLLALYELAQAM